MTVQRAPVQIPENGSPVATTLRTIVLRKLCKRIEDILKRYPCPLADGTLIMHLNGARGEPMHITREILRAAVSSPRGKELFSIEELLGDGFAVGLRPVDPPPEKECAPVTVALVDGAQLEFSVGGVKWGASKKARGGR